MKKRGFTLIELLVVVAIIAMLLAILMPALNKVKKIAQRVVCGTNLKGLGNAQVVYANDYDGQYACQGRGAAHTWEQGTLGWEDPSKNWNTPGAITVGASLYLLVRQADVSPKSFVCPAGNEQEFTGRNPQNLDIVDLFDFGGPGWATSPEGAGRTVSYAYHQPYAGGAGGATGQAHRYRADDQRSASFAMMADKNPWYDARLRVEAPTSNTYMEVVAQMALLTGSAPHNPHSGSLNDRQAVMIANAQPHEREGQNVLFADGHSSFEKQSNVGVRNDNIYTPWVSATPPATSPAHWECGRDMANFISAPRAQYPQALADSFLVNDFLGTAIRQ